MPDLVELNLAYNWYFIFFCTFQTRITHKDEEHCEGWTFAKETVSSFV